MWYLFLSLSGMGSVTKGDCVMDKKMIQEKYNVAEPSPRIPYRQASRH